MSSSVIDRPHGPLLGVGPPPPEIKGCSGRFPGKCLSLGLFPFCFFFSIIRLAKIKCVESRAGGAGGVRALFDH